ncbi:MAG: tetratricopeptide repeat protein [Thermonemataceae bacterium]|nr:tetratricopeptide repeat protein [Thermonemataceae bacterium]
MKITWLYLLLLLFFGKASFAQEKHLSLLQKLHTTTKEKDLVYLYQDIGDSYMFDKDNSDSARYYFQKSLALAQKLEMLRSQAKNYELIGESYERQGKRREAITYYEKAINYYAKVQDKKGVAACLNYIGIMYDYLGEFDKALSFLFRSARLKEEINNLSGLADVWNDIGIVYEEMNESEKALEYYKKSLQICEQTKAKPNKIANILNNMGVVCYDQNKLDEALGYFNRSLEIRLQTNSHNTEASYANIANIYFKKNNFQEANKLYQKSLALAEKLQKYDKIAQNSAAMASVKIRLGEYDSAQYYLDKSYKFSKERGYDVNFTYITHIQMELDSARGDYKKAFLQSRSYAELLSKQYNSEKAEQIAKLQTLYETERKENENRVLREMQKAQISENRLLRSQKEQEEAEVKLLKQEQEIQELANKRLSEKARYSKQENELLKKSQALKNLENKRLKIEKEAKDRQLQLQLWGLLASIGVIFLILALLFALYRSKNKTTQAYHLLQEKNEEINQQREEISSQADVLKAYNEQMQLQNEELLQLYTKLTDSIQYAERLQYALVSNENELQAIFQDSFVFSAPRDIVSGDFLWSVKVENYKIIAVADCTGHGVPGSMMTFLGVSALTQIVVERKIYEPHLILSELDKKIISFLSKNNEDLQQSDGMDIVLICLDTQKEELHFSGAKNPLYCVRDNEIITYTAAPYSLGFNIFEENKIFGTQKIPYQKDDMFFACSDGFQDQFGGTGNKPRKFLTKNLKEFFRSNALLPISEQKQLLSDTFEAWKGKIAQTDDVLVVGFKL